jgi:crotonobetainyl-CoA:carnitine CoA-transferase CaiB-like acyl-CoA transferase
MSRVTHGISNCLSGLRVVELGQVLAAPFGGMIFSDLGAEVIKVERPGDGDDGRRMGPSYADGDALIFGDLNRGKASVIIDFKSSKGLDELFALVGTADIVISNLRPGVAEGCGFDAASLRAQYPRLIYCTLTAFGNSGPMRERPGYEPLVQAFSGMASLNGYAQHAPVRTGSSVVDLGSGMWIVLSALAALRKRDSTGCGSTIDLSLLETALTWANTDSSSHLNEGKSPTRRGNGHPMLVPYEAFATRDGPLMIAIGNDRQFRKFAVALGRGAWGADPDFASNSARLLNRERLISMIQPIIAERSRAEWVAALASKGVPCAEFNSLPEALASEQVGAIDFISKSARTGRLMSGLPFTLDGHRPGNPNAAPALGEHTAAILSDVATTEGAEEPWFIN